MNVSMNREEPRNPHHAEREAPQSHLVHRAGTIGSGLFPGWGPKL